MTTQPGTPEYYEDDAGEVRWRVRDNNGEITEASSEGFVNLRKAFDNYTITRGNVQISYDEAEEQIHAQQSTGDPDSTGELADSSGSVGEGQEANSSGGKKGTSRSSRISSSDTPETDASGDHVPESPDDSEV